MKKGGFNQFVFDNVDFNVCTIDGLNTRHAMGGIRCIKHLAARWKGYMATITTGNFSENTRVITLPFINAPPSNYDTVYTALQYASELIQLTR